MKICQGRCRVAVGDAISSARGSQRGGDQPRGGEECCKEEPFVPAIGGQDLHDLSGTRIWLQFDCIQIKGLLKIHSCVLSQFYDFHQFRDRRPPPLSTSPRRLPAATAFLRRARNNFTNASSLYEWDDSESIDFSSSFIESIIAHLLLEDKLLTKLQNIVSGCTHLNDEV